jgi:hypothetical protein
LGSLQQTYLFMALANELASSAPVLDALLLAEEAGVEVETDGKKASVDHRAPQELRNRVRQCAHTLASMMNGGKQ